MIILFTVYFIGATLNRDFKSKYRNEGDTKQNKDKCKDLKIASTHQNDLKINRPGLQRTLSSASTCSGFSTKSCATDKTSENANYQMPPRSATQLSLAKTCSNFFKKAFVKEPACAEKPAIINKKESTENIMDTPKKTINVDKSKKNRDIQVPNLVLTTHAKTDLRKDRIESSCIKKIDYEQINPLNCVSEHKGPPEVKSEDFTYAQQKSDSIDNIDKKEDLLSLKQLFEDAKKRLIFHQIYLSELGNCNQCSQEEIELHNKLLKCKEELISVYKDYFE